MNEVTTTRTITSTTLPQRLVRQVCHSPLVTLEMRFTKRKDGDNSARTHLMIFVSPEEHKSTAVPSIQYYNFLQALEMLLERSYRKENVNDATGMVTCSFNNVEVRMNMTGIWIGFKNKTLTKIYDTGIRYIQTSAPSEVLIERHTPGLVISRTHLQRLIGHVELFIKAANNWSRNGVLDDGKIKFVENIIKGNHIFQYVPPSLSSKGSTNVTIGAYLKAGLPIITMCSSNTILTLRDDGVQRGGFTATEMFLTTVLQSLRQIQTRIKDYNFSPCKFELFVDTPWYDEQQYFNGYVSLVPSQRGFRIVINYDAIPAYSKLSWLLSEVSLDEVINSLEKLMVHYPHVNNPE